jgi:hypothetical protein
MKPIIVSGAADYTVTQKVGVFPNFTVYVCRLADGTEGLLKIANEVSHNGLLDREAYVLNILAEEMTQRDVEYKKRTGADKGLGFDRCIPRLIESFVTNSQSGRRLNILSFYGSKRVSEWVPLQQWRTREKVRIDAKSSAWIMGRLLKIFTLIHPAGIEIGSLSGQNILVHPENHHVTLFDWTGAVSHIGAVPKRKAADEISRAAHEVIVALGGDWETRSLPPSDQLPDNRYATMLFDLERGRYSDSFKAGQEFYELLNDLWEKSFHPFTTHPN